MPVISRELPNAIMSDSFFNLENSEVQGYKGRSIKLNKYDNNNNFIN